MAATEGVIQFRLDFTEAPPSPPETLFELNAWRTIFKRLGLLGQDPQRYDGYGFGNLSRRVPHPTGGNGAFLISGTQTGGREVLRPEHYVTVLECDAARNRVVAEGPIKPSSESLTHGLLYRTDSTIAWVMHLHSPDIFRCRDPLVLPVTARRAECGTPELAEEVARIHAARAGVDPQLIVMGGHEDGILAYGSDAHATGSLVVATLARALQIPAS